MTFEFDFTMNYFSFYVYGYFVCMYVRVYHGYSALKGQKSALEPVKLELDCQLP